MASTQRVTIRSSHTLWSYRRSLSSPSTLRSGGPGSLRSRQIALAAAQTPFPHAPGSRRWRGGGHGRRCAGGRCEALPGPAGRRPRRDLPWLRGAGGAGSGGANILALGGTKATRFAWRPVIEGFWKVSMDWIKGSPNYMKPWLSNDF